MLLLLSRPERGIIMEKVLENGICLKLMPSEYDVYLDMAMTMLDAILRCRDEGRPCAMIVPVGPTGQYPILAELVNRMGISLKHVHIFNMDEYLMTPTQPIDPGHPMSFHARMEKDLYSRLREDLAVPFGQRHFPEPGKEQEYDRMIEDIGGIELCLGGLGINGHIAFNEPPEKENPMTAEEFAALNTRVLPITRETRTVNAIGYQRGDIRGMPEWCITVGMRQILASRAVYIALSRDWQHGIAMHALHDPAQAAIPATLLQTHKSVTYCAPEAIGQGL